MPTNHNFPHEQPSTYFVQDRSNKEEVVRLQIQDQLITAGMGGVLPEQPDPSSLRNILDVGCGTGGWLIETARTYPTITRLIGVDVSNKLLDYARAQAAEQQVAGRVEFFVRDVLRSLEFPDASFDLVNQRLGMSYLRTWDWPQTLAEYQRVTRPGGVIRITESSFPTSGSESLTRLSALFIRALSQAGHLFIQDDPNGVFSELPQLLQRHGLTHVQTRQHTLVHRAGTPEGQSFYEDTQHMFRTIVPFFQKWTRVPDDYEKIYQQALSDIQQPGFVATWPLLTVWGIRA
jgi:ubiquinone/menaquinone biosynthesis C-methylase UbiE